MIKTIYTCDRCSREQADSKDRPVEYGDVRVGYGFGYGETQRVAALWCRPCMEEFHLLTSPPREGVPVTTPQPSLEDILRAIIREEMQS